MFKTLIKISDPHNLRRLSQHFQFTLLQLLPHQLLDQYDKCEQAVFRSPRLDESSIHTDLGERREER